MQTQIIYLDMVPGGIPPVAHVSQGDTGARKLYFRILNNGELFDTSGLTAVMYGKKPDGAMFSYGCDVYQYSIQRSCTEQMTAVAGQTLCELRLTDGDGVVGTANFILDIEENPTEGATASSSQFTEFQALANAANGYAANAAQSATAADASAKAAAQSATSVANAYRYNAVTTAGTSLDDYITTGFYYFSSSYTPANVPDGAVSGLLMVSALAPTFTSGTYLKQIFFRQGAGYSWRAYVRTRNDAGWSAWYQYLTPSDITGAISEIVTANLDTGRAVATNGYGKLIAATPTLAELNYLSGVTANVQGQITAAKNDASSALNAALAVMPTFSNSSGLIGDSSTSAPNDSLVTVGSFKLTAGLWLVILMGRWTAGGGSSPGRRQLMVTASTDAETPINWNALTTIPAVNGSLTVNHLPMILYVSSETTYYVRAYQNSGASITIYPRIASARLGAGVVG